MCINIFISRFYFGQCFLGHLTMYRGGISVFDCDTLEPPFRKCYGAIPDGEYKATIYHSPKFDRDVLLLHDVPGRSMIEIHPGNTLNDTRGCILVGQRPFGRTLINSRSTMSNLMSRLSPDDDITVTVQ